jgi:hypothetical protein
MFSPDTNYQLNCGPNLSSRSIDINKRDRQELKFKNKYL